MSHSKEQTDQPKEESATTPKIVRVITWVTIGILSLVVVLSALSGSPKKESTGESMSENHGVSPSSHPTFTLKYADTLRIFPGEGFYLNLDSVASGLAIFPNLVTIQFEPTGPYQLLRKGQPPLTGYPGIQDVRWGIIPNEVRFRALGEKCTLLITTKGE